MKRYILSPGMKRRVLEQLYTLIRAVEDDKDRDTITYHTAELMPMVANQFAYTTQETPKKKRKKPRVQAYAVDLGSEGR